MSAPMPIGFVTETLEFAARDLRKAVVRADILLSETEHEHPDLAVRVRAVMRAIRHARLNIQTVGEALAEFDPSQRPTPATETQAAE